jgi:transketolase
VTGGAAPIRRALVAPVSLSDRADLPALRATAAGLDGPFATVAACLVAGGALEHDPGEPDWPDRDRVIAGEADAASALSALLSVDEPQVGAAADALDRSGVRATEAIRVLPAWEALPLAVGLAAASRLDGGVFRTWCLLGATAVHHGATWEAARAAADVHLDTLVTVVAAPKDAAAEAARVLEAAGWQVTPARGDDPAELLGALDRALAAARPVLIAAVTA